MIQGKCKHVMCYDQADIDAMPADARAFSGITLPGWYFWDETEAGAHGPFDSEAITEENLSNYAATL